MSAWGLEMDWCTIFFTENAWSQIRDDYSEYCDSDLENNQVILVLVKLECIKGCSKALLL